MKNPPGIEGSLLLSDNPQIINIYESISQHLILSMIDRIKYRGEADLEREPWLWQLEKLNDMHMLNQKNIEYIIKETGIAKELLEKIIKNEGLKVYESSFEQLSESTGKAPTYNNVTLALEGYIRQMFLDLDNFCNQTLLSTVFVSNIVMFVYKAIIEEIVAQVVTGTMTKDQAIRNVIGRWIEKGFPSQFFDKSGRRWSIEAYARMVIQSTMYRVYNDMRLRASEEFGINTFYYSMHAASRPACAPIQNQVVTKGASFYSDILGYKVESLNDHGFGEAGGCLGINCKHYLTPFIIGVNQLPNLSKGMENITAKQAIENGKKQAKQRAFERAIRQDKKELQAAKLLDDTTWISKVTNSLGTHRQGLRDLIQKNGFLYRDSQREKIY